MTRNQAEYWTDGSHRFWYGETFAETKPVLQLYADRCSDEIIAVRIDNGERFAGFTVYPTAYELAKAWEATL